MAPEDSNPQEDINDHGDKIVKARFGPKKPLTGGDDRETSTGDKPGGALSGEAIQQKEAGIGSSASQSGAEQEEKKSFIKRGLKNSPASEGQSSDRFNFGGLRAQFTRKKTAGLVAILVLGGSGFAGFTILQGPLQFIHLAQNLQEHLKSNEDFGNDRTSKVLLYALLGQGAQNGRLGVTGNSVANKWEKRLLNDTGLRPVYQEGTKRFVGFELVDEDKANNFLGEAQGNDTKKSKNIEKVMGDGARVVNGEAGIFNSEGKRLDSSNRFIDLRDQKFGERRKFIKSIGRATSTHNIASSIGSRALVKRAGVDFHPMNKTKRYTDDQIAKILEKRRSNIQEGVKTNDGVKTTNTVDGDNDGTADEPDAKDVEASEESKKYIDDFKNSGAFKTATSSAIVVGVMCAAKAYGNSVEDYKFQNNVLPMMRMGFNATATGNQVMSNDDFDLGAMGVLSQFLYDKEKKTSWSDAESIRAKQGRSGGVPMPKEANVESITDKPKFFDVIDSIPFLGTACDAQEGFFGLPIIKQVSGVITSVTQEMADAALSLGGTSTDELLQSSLKAVSGRSVDPDAKGADYGSFTDSGMFFAANEQGLSVAGSPMSDEDRAKLGFYEEADYVYEHQNKSFTQRYFDPYDHRSLVASAIDASPVNANQATDMVASPVKTVASSFHGLFTAFFPKAKAATQYNYGVPKFGFTLSERNNDIYENPYENATRENKDGVSLEKDLPRLNEEYGKKCFGVEVTAEDDGVHVKQADEKVNIFKVYNPKSKDYKPECDATKNTDDRFNQYRFYIADAMTAISLACYEGDEDYCAEAGIGSGGGASEATGDPTLVTGTPKELAQKLLDYKKDGKYSCDNPVDCEDLEFMVAGKSIKGGTYNACKVDALDPRVMKLIIYLIDKGYKIGTYALCRSHSDTGGVHDDGLAVDISSINGTPLNNAASKEDTLKVAEIIFKLQNGITPKQIISGGVGATRVLDKDFEKYNRISPGVEGSAAVAGFGSSTIAGHTDHLHIGY